MQNHQDENRVTWAPDGWFGELVNYDESQPNKMLKRPIVEDEFIKQFREDFNISREDEPGTSIVIPHIHLSTDSESEDAQFNQRNLVRAVLRNFLVAIHDNELRVEVQVGKGGERIVIDKDSFTEYGSFLPEPGEKDALVTTLHHRLIIDTQKADFPDAQKFTLKTPGESPAWKPEMFNEEQLKAMQKMLHEKKPIVVTIPMPVRRKHGGTVEVKSASFRAIIKRNELTKALPPVFYRVGLLIDSVATTALNNYIAAVLIDRDDLADLLVAAEPPSHSKWNYNTDRVLKRYDKPRAHIQFVAYCVRNILDQIASCDQQANWDPLSDVFGIRKPKDGNKPDDGEGNSETDGEKTHEEKLRIVAFSVIDGSAKGIRVHNDEGLQNVADDKFPFRAKFVVGYDTFRGLSWSPNDFDLATGNGGVSVTVKAGTVETEANGNAVTLTIKDKSDFTVEIVGFDPNRDATAEKLRYEYPKKEDGNGEQV